VKAASFGAARSEPMASGDTTVASTPGRAGRRRIRSRTPSPTVLALLLVAAGGCGAARWLLHPPPRLGACPGPIPSTATLAGGDFVWHDRVRYRGGAVDAGFSLVAEKRGARLVLVGLDAFGARAFSVTQDGLTVEADARMGRALAVPPETVLRDWHSLRAAAAGLHEPLALARPECGYEVTLVAESHRPVSAAPSP
jgi:hypothetical protein